MVDYQHLCVRIAGKDGVGLWLLIALLLIVFGGDIGTMFEQAKAHTPEHLEWDWEHGSISDLNRTSFEAGVALILAITAAEMFSQGNWQRAWASEDDEALEERVIGLQQHWCYL